MLKPSVKAIKVTEFMDPETGERYPSIQEANEAIVIREFTTTVTGLFMDTDTYKNNSCYKSAVEEIIIGISADIAASDLGLKLYDALKKYFD